MEERLKSHVKQAYHLDIKRRPFRCATGCWPQIISRQP